MYQPRFYRRLSAVKEKNLISFKVVVKETDLFVSASTPLQDITKDLIIENRKYIEEYIKHNPKFAKSLIPLIIKEPAAKIINDMAQAGKIAGVGPMAAVAGSLAEHVGISLLKYSDQIIVENGGDIFLKVKGDFTAGIFAGNSPFSMRLGLRIQCRDDPLGICTSSGTVGHSFSMGNADAVCVVSKSCSLADAAATSICNRIKSKNDIQKAVDFGKKIQGVEGLVILIADNIGVWGKKIELVPV